MDLKVDAIERARVGQSLTHPCSSVDSDTGQLSVGQRFMSMFRARAKERENSQASNI